MTINRNLLFLFEFHFWCDYRKFYSLKNTATNVRFFNIMDKGIWLKFYLRLNYMSNTKYTNKQLIQFIHEHL